MLLPPEGSSFPSDLLIIVVLAGTERFCFRSQAQNHKIIRTSLERHRNLETRQAALCLIRHGNAFLVAEIQDPQTSAVLHRPPGGGIEEGETPEQALRRELREELGITLTTTRELGKGDHVWFWKGREVRERAWLFLASSSDDARLSRGECPELVEADGQCIKTLWRPIEDNTAALSTSLPIRDHGIPEMIVSCLFPQSASAVS